MTICENIGKFQTTVKDRFIFGYTERKIELNITWISSGVYQMDATRIDEKEEDENSHIQPKTDFKISLTPEWIQKTVELYPEAERRPRNELYKPFYEDFRTDQGMFDMGCDTLFQAFKDQLEERVILTTYHFNYGVPAGVVEVLNLEFDEFKLLKEYLDNPNGRGSEIFYSGVQFC